MNVLQDLLIVSPLLALFFSSFMPLLIKVFRKNKEPDPFTTLMYSFMGLLVAIGLTTSMKGLHVTAFSGAISWDGVSSWGSYLVYMVAAFSLMLAYDNAATKGRQFSEFAFLLMSSSVGLLILLMANDLIVTFIGIETMSLALYLLIAMSREAKLAKEAAFKYFVLGSFASAIFLYGIAFIYGTVGATDFPHIAENALTLLTTNRLFLIGSALVIIGFGFKVAMFPMQSWVPDVYEGSPTPVTAFMSAAVKAISFIAFLRFFHTADFSGAPAFATLLQWLAAATMIVGNVAALKQQNLKRMLAYSSIAHSGYALIGLITAGFGDNFNAGATSLLFYLFSYSVMSIGTFAVVAVFEKSENTKLNLADLRGLGRNHPVLGISLTVMMLSLAGLPPTVGFFAKFYIFSAAIQQDYYWLAFWGIMSSLVSVYYYLRPVAMLYMSDEQGAEVLLSSFFTRMTIALSAVAILAMGLFSAPVLRAVQNAILKLV
jgi:NADH-quinone oxidoreductase subunit N